MKILQLSKKFPYPLKDGESIAITYLAKALHELDCEVSLLSMNTSKHFFEANGSLEKWDYYKQIHLVPVDNRVKIKDAFLNLFSKESYHISRFISKEFEAKLIDLLQQNNYDIVQLETLYLAPYVDIIRQYSTAKIVMRSHNVEHEIWKRIAQNTNLKVKKIYLNLLTKRLENFELEYLNKYDMMVAITQRDLDFFRDLGCDIPAHVSPIGLELGDYQQVLLKHKQATFCFIGSLDWMPNVEGVEWLLDKVWPTIIDLLPEAVFHIAGRNTPDWLLQKKLKNVVIHGEVPSAVDFINSHDIMLVPLFSGSGMRVKILEGMALGKVILSTSIGMEGIHAQNGKDALIADSPEAFIKAIKDCFNQPNLVKKIGASASSFIHDNYDNVSIAKKLLTFYEEQISCDDLSKTSVN